MDNIMQKSWEEHFSENPIIAQTMKERNMTANEAFAYLYMSNFSIETTMPTHTVNSLIEFYEIKEVAGVLSPIELKNLNLLYALKEYKSGEVITIPAEIQTADEFYDWLRKS